MSSNTKVTNKRQLGNVFTNSDAANAYASELIPSLSHHDSSTTAAVRVAFRNETCDRIMLCWISFQHVPHHFYRLPPSCKHGDRHVTMEDHVETTALGHSFIFALDDCPPDEPSNGESSSLLSDDDLRNDVLNDNVGVVASRDTQEANALLSPTCKIPGWCCCCNDKGMPSSVEGIKTENDTVIPSSSHTHTLHARDVIGAYRPTCSSLLDEDCVHIVTIHHRRSHKQQSKSFFGLRGHNNNTKKRYMITVQKGSLAKCSPIDTTGKYYEDMTLGECFVDDENVCGWPVKCEPSALFDNGIVRDRLTRDVTAASSRLPPHARKLLMESTPIWINRSIEYGPCVAPITGRDSCFHPEEEWLTRMGMSPNKAGGIEIYDADRYMDDVDLWGYGGVLLHELSHAFHHKFVPDGFENKDILHCYEMSMKRGLYDSVQVHSSSSSSHDDTIHHDNEWCRAYACENCMEYFAELSTAFLGGLDDDEEYNKWFPHNRRQILEHDPRAYTMLQRIWGVTTEKKEEMKKSKD